MERIIKMTRLPKNCQWEHTFTRVNCEIDLYGYFIDGKYRGIAVRVTVPSEFSTTKRKRVMYYRGEDYKFSGYERFINKVMEKIF